MSHVVFISDAIASWRATKSSLSPSTRTAYAGEVSRFEEFCISRRVNSVTGLSSDLWHSYLATLRDGRDEVRSKRQAILSTGSARQAMRITRDFLAWLRDESLIGWKPLAPARDPTPVDQEPLPSRTRNRPLSTRRLAGKERSALTLTKAAPMKDEAAMRRELAGNLIFWAALRPAELATIHVSHVKRIGRGLVQMQIPGRPSSCHVPGHVWTLWTRYRQAREQRLGHTLAQDSALICSLQGNSALSTWSVWSLVKQPTKEVARSPRELRAAFLEVLTDDAARALSQARVACGLPRLGPAAVSMPPSTTPNAIARTLSRAGALVASMATEEDGSV